MEDRTNWYPTPCPRCDGYGAIGHTVTVYEHGCAFPHPDTEEIPCPECKGHASITAVLDATGDVRAGQKFARHSNVNTTMIYDDNREDLGGRAAERVAAILSGE